MLRYAALLPILPKVVQVLSKGEISSLVSAVVPGDTAEIVRVLNETKGMVAEDGLKHILDAPVVANFLQGKVDSAQGQSEEDSRTLFVRCPLCEGAFETVIVPQS